MPSYLHTELKAEIELTREKFHRLLATIPEEALTLPSKDPDWTNGELLYRMSIAALIILSTLKKNRTDKSKTSAIHQIVTGPLIQRTNELFIRARAANSTRWSIAKEYAETCARVLEMLEEIPTDGFERKVVIFEDDLLLPKPATIEQLFHYVRNHFEVYRQQINPGT
jgi:hypothetical protein